MEKVGLKEEGGGEGSEKLMEEKVGRDEGCGGEVWRER
jgi:hypothetical protein